MTSTTSPSSSSSSSSCCSLCMGDQSDEVEKKQNALARYCAQCNAEMHPDCMLELLNRTANNTVAIPFVEKVELSDYLSRGGGKVEKRDNHSLLLLPPLPEHVLQMLLNQWLFSNGGQLVARQVYIRSAGVGTPTIEKIAFEPFARSIDETKEACTHFDAIRFKMMPRAKCIQCRFKTDFCTDSSTAKDNVEKSRNLQQIGKRERGVSLGFLMCYLVHVWAVSCCALFFHRSCSNVIGVWALVLPLPAIIYFIVWSIIAGPMLILWPSFYEQLNAICYNQRRRAFCTDAEMLGYAVEIQKEEEKEAARKKEIQEEKEIQTSIVSFVSFNVANPFCKVILEFLVPLSYNTVFATAEGFSFARMLWTGKPHARLEADQKFAFSKDEQSSAILHLPAAPTTQIDLRNAPPMTFNDRLANCAVFLLADMFSIGKFGGPSLQTIFIIFAMTMSHQFVWQSFAISVVFETLRLSLYAYFAWRWLPRNFPLFCIDDATLRQPIWRLAPQSKSL